MRSERNYFTTTFRLRFSSGTLSRYTPAGRLRVTRRRCSVEPGYRCTDCSCTGRPSRSVRRSVAVTSLGDCTTTSMRSEAVGLGYTARSAPLTVASLVAVMVASRKAVVVRTAGAV